jgi:hypothetical protein
VKRFRELLKREKLKAYETLITKTSFILEPPAAHRARAKKLWAGAQPRTASKK